MPPTYCKVAASLTALEIRTSRHATCFGLPKSRERKSPLAPLRCFSDNLVGSEPCSNWRISSRPFGGSSLLNAWPTPKIQGDSALGVKLDAPFPVHFVEIEYAFTATPQYAKELTAFNPIIGHVVNPFSNQCN